MKFKMAQMYQNQLSWQNQLKCIKISSVVKTALLSRIQGTDGSIFHPDVQKNETLFLFNKVYISLIRLYLKNFSPRICANLFPWNTRRRQFTTASQPIGKLINHVQNLSFYFFDHVQNLSFYFFSIMFRIWVSILDSHFLFHILFWCSLFKVEQISMGALV